MKKIFFVAASVLCMQTAMGQTILSLEKAVELALENNRTLQNAALDLEIADSQKKEARSKYFPQVSAQVMAFLSFDELMKGEGTIPDQIAALGDDYADMVGQPFSYAELNKSYAVALTAIQPIYAGGQIATGNKLASLNQEVMALQKQLKEKDIIQRVTENFWQIASMKYNLKALDAGDRQLEEVAKTTAVYVEAGLTNRNDLLKVQLQQQQLASNRLKIENAEHVLRLLLAQMVGMAGTDVDIEEQGGEVASPESVFMSSAEAVNSREELLLAQKGVEAGELQKKLERAKLLPSVAVGVSGVNYGMGGLSDEVKNYYDPMHTNGFVFGTVSIPISAWWSDKHSVNVQKQKLQQAENDMADAQEQLLIDIESAWSNLVEAYKQVEIAQQSVEQAAENLRIVNDQYKAGTIALSDMLDAETLDRQTKSQLASALATYYTQRCAYVLKVGAEKAD